MAFSQNLLRNASSALALLACGIADDSAWAVERIYSIITDQSSVAVSGTLTTSAGTAPIQQQGAGSLVASYSGTIRTDRRESSIQFLSGSTVDANVSGNWQPLPNGEAGFALADYGGRASYLFGVVVVNFAARDIIGDLMSEALNLDPLANFGLSTTSLSFVDGSVAYRSSSFVEEFGAESLVGQSGTLSGTGSLSTQMEAEGLFETVLIPIDVSVAVAIDESSSIDLTLTGQLVATAMLPSMLAGDFNNNGTVDVADYVLWRKNNGMPEDYNTWRANFGATASSGSLSTATVPEPSSVWLLILGGAVASWRVSRISWRVPSIHPRERRIVSRRLKIGQPM